MLLSSLTFLSSLLSFSSLEFRSTTSSRHIRAFTELSTSILDSVIDDAWKYRIKMLKSRKKSLIESSRPYLNILYNILRIALLCILYMYCILYCIHITHNTSINWKERFVKIPIDRHFFLPFLFSVFLCFSHSFVRTQAARWLLPSGISMRRDVGVIATRIRAHAYAHVRAMPSSTLRSSSL